jgi:hypothetical protein
MTGKKSEKVQILTVLSESWSVRKNQQELDYLVWISKKLVAEKGDLSRSNVKPDRMLSSAVAEMMKQFLCLIKSAGSCQGPIYQYVELFQMCNGMT